jgi:hypothetical protein
MQEISFQGVNTEGVGLALTLLRLNHIMILETEQEFCISALHLQKRNPTRGSNSRLN